MLLMKRFTFWAVAVVAVMLAGTAKAQESKLLKVENYTFSKWNPETMSNELTDTPQPYGNDVNYYYDADGQLSMEYEIYPTGTSGTLKIYAYNEQGQVSSIERLSGGGQPQVTEYFYDDQGRLVKEQQNNNGFYSGYVYDEFDEHGNYTVRKMLSSDGISTGTEHHFAYTYDADGQLIEAVTLIQNWDDPTAFTPSQRTLYTYADGLLATETLEENMGEGYRPNWTKTYTYNDDGTVKEIKLQYAYGGFPSYWGYTYGALDVAKKVIGVELQSQPGNTIHVAWQPVDGATSYLVIIDGACATVEGTEYTSAGVLDGEHLVLVLAIIDGVSQNTVDKNFVEVKDQGNVAMENLTIDKVELDVTVYDWGYTAFNYNVYFSWTVPEGASPISSYTLYCDNGSSWVQQAMITQFNNPGVDFNKMTTGKVSFTRSTFQNNHTDENWQTIYDEGGPDCKFWLTATYESGESPQSNVVELNPYSVAVKSDAYLEYETTTGISSISNNGAPAEIYTLQGVRTAHANGLVIERRGGQTRKVVVKR